MPTIRQTNEALKAARAQLKTTGEPFTERDVEREAGDLLTEWQADAADEREHMGHYHDDTPSLENCDDAGTGEGRWHGRM